MFGEEKYEAQSRYDDWNTTQVKLKLNKKQTKISWTGSSRKSTAVIPLYRVRLKL